jgi:hypothetical protein
MIDPGDEQDFFETHFSPGEITAIARHLDHEPLAEALYFAIYAEGTNAEKNLAALRAWVGTNATRPAPGGK